MSPGGRVSFKLLSKSLSFDLSACGRVLGKKRFEVTFTPVSTIELSVSPKSTCQRVRRPCLFRRMSTWRSYLCFLSLSARSSDSEEAFETPESTTPVKAPPAPPPPPPEVTPEPEVSTPPAPEEPGNQISGATGSRGQSWLLDSSQPTMVDALSLGCFTLYWYLGRLRVNIEWVVLGAY